MWLDVDVNQTFSSVKVLEMRSAESQAGPEDARLLGDSSGGPAPHGEATRRAAHGELPPGELSLQAPYALNFSFEELNTLGLDDGAPRHSNLSWQVFTEGAACHIPGGEGGIEFTGVEQVHRDPRSETA